MTQALQDIRNFTVMIQDAKTGNLAGTGFIILSDGEKVKIVTAAHVVNAIFKVPHPRLVIGETVGVYFPQARELSLSDRRRKAKVEACLEEYDDDVILLALQGKDPRPSFFQNQAILGVAEPSHKNPYISYGFPDIGAYPESTIDGRIVDLTPSHKQGIYQCEVVELNANSKAAKIRRGMSGGAVLDKYRNLVVGIVTSFVDSSLSSKAWAADCKVLSFKPFGLNLLHDVNPVGIPMTPGQAFNRRAYVSVSKPGLELVDAPKSLKHWVGRKDLLESIRKAWRDPECNLLELAGFGGQGKSSLAKKWLELFISAKSESKPKGIFWWDFYQHKNLDEFAEKLLSFLSISLGTRVKRGSLYTKFREIENQLKDGSFLLVLDGFEVLQFQAGDYYGEIKDNDMHSFMTYLASENHHSFAIVTTRVPLLELVNKIYYRHIDVDEMSIEDGYVLLKKLGVKGSKDEISGLVEKWAGHPLTLTLLGTYIFEKYGGDLSKFTDLPSPELDEPQYERLRRLLVRYDQFFAIDERRFLQIFSAFRSTVDTNTLRDLFMDDETETTKLLAKLSREKFSELVQRLVIRGFIREAEIVSHSGTGKNKKATGKAYNAHPLVKNYFYDSMSTKLRNAINTRILEYIRTIKVPKRPKTIEQMRPALDEVYYLCETGRYDDAYLAYQKKVAKVDLVPEDETGYLTTVLSGYQADLEQLVLFFPDKDLNNTPILKDPRDVADVLLITGVDLEYLGNANQAYGLYEKSAQIGIKNNEFEYATWSYENQGTGLISAGQMIEGVKVLENALRYTRKIKSWARESMSTLLKMAWGKFLLGEIESAYSLIEQAKDVYAKDMSGDKRSFECAGEGSYYSEILARTGRLEEALIASNHNLVFLKEEGWVDDVGCNRVIGMIYEMQNDQKKAKRYYDKGVRAVFEQGVREETTLALLRRGNLLIDLKELEQAKDDLEYALSMAQSYNYLWELDIRNALVKLAMTRDEARKLYNQLKRDLIVIKSKADEIGYKWAQCDSLRLLGQLENLHGNRDESIVFYNQGLILQKQLRDPGSAQTQLILQELNIP